MSRFAGKKTAFAFLIALFLMVNIGGFFAAENMMTMGEGSTHSCPFMDVPSLCSMSPLDHLVAWQEMLAATTEQASIVVFSLLLALAVVFIGYTCRDFALLIRVAIPISRNKRETGRFFDPLRLAFARGVIHSKEF
jgi:hypothetical protein